MDTSSIKTLLQIPWGSADDALPLSLAEHPQRSESGGEAAPKSPEIPLFRVREDGAVAVLNHLGGQYLPAGTLRWFDRGADGGTTRVRAAAHPFAGRGDLLAADFFVTGEGGLVLLEKFLGEDGQASSRLAILSPQGKLVAACEGLDDGPYERIVPDEAGRLLLLGHGGGNRLRELDLRTAELGKRHDAEPGSRAALEANRGTFVSRNQLEALQPARIKAPPEVPSALVRIFGVDGGGAYYAALDAEIAKIHFGGVLARRIRFKEHPELSATVADGLVSRLSPPLTWQVDRAGRIHLGRADAKKFSILRISTP